jgi:putative addiction module component (TIGR02574 family)
MNARARQLLDELLQLSVDDRLLIAAELNASLESDEDDASPEEIEKAWAEEIMRRVENIRAGRSKGRDAFEALAEIRARLGIEKR